MVKGNFDFEAIEAKWKKFWEKEKIYKFNPHSKEEIYSIDTPPPTLSGGMHIGHTCSYSQQDFIVRYKRMRGFNIFYPFGADDNGLPTERLVEKRKGVRSKEMQRADFVELCMKFLKEERPKFIQDWKNIGISCDWNLAYSTIDNHSRRISQWSFLDLYKKKRMYRKDAPAMWCPECRTGVAQVEVQDKEVDSTFNDIVFKVDNKDLIIATTRPELLPACVAIFYHPDDKRFKKYQGKDAKVPLFDFEVPILEDKRVDPKKGTGIVMCCTFGDQTDMEWQKAYNLEIKMAIDEKGCMTNVAGKYKGLKVKKARKEIISDLKKNNLLTSQKPIVHVLNVHERCGAEIEFVKSKQWFLKYLDLKKEMLKWGSELVWFPKHMKNRYDTWVKGLQWDWLVSNQRHFGVAFPVWYCKDCGEVIVAEEKQLPVDPIKDKPPVKICPKCKSKEFIPETDVLNTWFTSSMTPQIVTQLVDEKIQKKIFPMNLRPQAHEIISFWLFNSVVKSNLHYKKNPWKDVVISGFVTLKGEKMSKSKGNAINPQEIMAKYGADAIRYWAASSKLGADFDYQEKDVITGKKFITKLTNATNFVFMNLEDWNGKKPNKLEKDDVEFLGKLNTIIEVSTKNFDKYEYSKVKQDVDQFFWSDFCDYYLETVKELVYKGKGHKKLSAQYTLYKSLLTILKLMAPFTPFITEEIYQKYFKKFEKEKSIHISEWPKQGKEKYKDDWQIIKENISKIRQIKSEAHVSLNVPVGKVILPVKDYEIIKNYKERFVDVSGAQRLESGKEFKVEILPVGTEHKL
jgi:valyl-tRNA synthetase